MDIFNRLPSISEDTLHYVFYPPPQSSDKTSVTSLATCVHEYVDELLPNFIWHRDGFELKAAEDPDAKSWFLEGHMRVGDCVDDEWCVVWLLREISSKWDLVIRCVVISFPSLVYSLIPPLYDLKVFMITMESSCSLRLQKTSLHG